MIKKQFVVIANSVKHKPGRCIAGMEIAKQTSKGICFGDWIRPVSRSGEGELYPAYTKLQDGTQPQVFDVVEIECERRCDDPSQPENWLVSENTKWVLLTKLDPSILIRLSETPKNLWLQPGAKTDRVTPEYLASTPPKQSLYLLRLTGAILLESGRKFRLRFSYQNIYYDLAVTDPTIAMSQQSLASNTIPDCFACVSLTPPFSDDFGGNYHYKLVAALFLQKC